MNNTPTPNTPKRPPTNTPDQGSAGKAAESAQEHARKSAEVLPHVLDKLHKVEAERDKLLSLVERLVSLVERTPGGPVEFKPCPDFEEVEIEARPPGREPIVGRRSIEWEFPGEVAKIVLHPIDLRVSIMIDSLPPDLKALEMLVNTARLEARFLEPMRSFKVVDVRLFGVRINQEWHFDGDPDKVGRILIQLIIPRLQPGRFPYAEGDHGLFTLTWEPD